MEDKIIELKLTVKQVNVVLAHLSKGIFGEVTDTINAITAQGNPQVAAYQNPPGENPKIPPEPIQYPENEPKPETVN